uniref:NUC153 domain-containing protein n=1 Tax=Soboliphyme baturini TaxID=241478 RepID=A0A183ISI7_9BILA
LVDLEKPSFSSDVSDEHSKQGDKSKESDQPVERLRLEPNLIPAILRRSEGEDDVLDDEDDDGKIRLDLARGSGNVSTSEESDSDLEEQEDDAESELEHHWGELDADAPRTEEATARIAVCNMDWSHITAKDLLALFNSFKPASGVIKEVKIYQSEFGREQMAKEEVNGPLELFGSEGVQSDEDEEPQDERKKRQLVEKIRLHELNRLRYFYAIVECDSAETAASVYDGCDGVEYENSSTKMDLRFVPDNMSFDESFLSDQASNVEDFSHYHPAKFVTAALQHTNVPLSWEETDDRRKTAIKEAFNKVSSDDCVNLESFIASSSSEESAEEDNEETVRSGMDDGIYSEQDMTSECREKMREKYRQLLDMDESVGKRSDTDLELKVNFEPGLDNNESELSSEDDVSATKKEQTQVRREMLFQAKSNFGKDDKTSALGKLLPQNWRKNSKDSRLVDGKKKIRKTIPDDAERRPIKKVLSRNTAKSQNVSFKLNVEDKRFDAIYNNALYNIDPSEPCYKNSEGMELIKEEKRRRLSQKWQLLEQRAELPVEKTVDSTVKSTFTSFATFPENDTVESLVSKLKSKSTTLRKKIIAEK